MNPLQSILTILPAVQQGGEQQRGTSKYRNKGGENLMAAEFTEYEYVAAGTVDVSQLPPLDRETERIMKDEFATGSKLTIFYYVFIFMIPILNWYASGFMFSRLWGGMTYSWFLTGIVAMAMAFIIAYVHTSLYEKRLHKYQGSAGASSANSEGRNIG